MCRLALVPALVWMLMLAAPFAAAQDASEEPSVAVREVFAAGGGGSLWVVLGLADEQFIIRHRASDDDADTLTYPNQFKEPIQGRPIALAPAGETAYIVYRGGLMQRLVFDVPDDLPVSRYEARQVAPLPPHDQLVAFTASARGPVALLREPTGSTGSDDADGTDSADEADEASSSESSEQSGQGERSEQGDGERSGQGNGDGEGDGAATNGESAESAEDDAQPRAGDPEGDDQASGSDDADASSPDASTDDDDDDDDAEDEPDDANESWRFGLYERRGNDWRSIPLPEGVDLTGQRAAMVAHAPGELDLLIWDAERATIYQWREGRWRTVSLEITLPGRAVLVGSHDRTVIVDRPGHEKQLRTHVLWKGQVVPGGTLPLPDFDRLLWSATAYGGEVVAVVGDGRGNLAWSRRDLTRPAETEVAVAEMKVTQRQTPMNTDLLMGLLLLVVVVVVTLNWRRRNKRPEKSD